MTRARMNTAAAANAGVHRAAGQTSSGRSMASGRMVNQWSVDQPKPSTPTKASTASMHTPSTSSERSGGSRRVRAIPIISGATVTTPTTPQANQCTHAVRNVVSDVTNKANPAAPPDPPSAIAIPVARKKPSTRGKVSRLKSGPWWRSISHDIRMAWPAPHMREDQGRWKAALADETQDRCDRHPDGHRHPCGGPERNEGSSSNAGRGPEHSDAIRRPQQSKAQPHRQKVANADRHREADCGSARRPSVAAGRRAIRRPHPGAVQHIRISPYTRLKRLAAHEPWVPSLRAPAAGVQA